MPAALPLSTLGLSLALVASLGDLGPVPQGTVRVYLVRHGQALSNLSPPPDLPPEKLDHLTDLGRGQARRVGAALAALGVDRVLSSPAGRALESAEEIRSLLKLPPVQVEPRLRPLELGRAASGAPLSWDVRIGEWKAGRDPSPPGGESLEQLARRLVDLIGSLAAERKAGARVVVVAHSEVVGALVGRLEGRSGAQLHPSKIANGSITVVEAQPAAPPALRLVNFVPPEPPSPRP